ncbi:MAG: methyltransferase domain-containing protein [Chthoniobacteraceae bacterium]
MHPNLFNESVDLDRWKEAQQWEEDHWIHTQRQRAKFGKNFVWRALSACGFVPKLRGDDWNQWWRDRFDGYRFLPERLDNVLEAGCGPYTNVRLVLERSRINHLFLSDPLIRTYVNFKLTFVADMYHKAGCILDDHPLEELPFASDYFDLAVMINVLDHVRDARACMDHLVRCVKPGGFLIIGQDLSDTSDVDRLASDPGLTGHPIKLQHDWFAPWLKSGFEPVIDRLLSREEGRAPDMHYGTLVFAGRKLA